MKLNKTVLTHALQVAITTERREAAQRQRQPANLLLEDEIDNESDNCGQPTHALQSVSSD